jgi:hypothetical protein
MLLLGRCFVRGDTSLVLNENVSSDIIDEPLRELCLPLSGRKVQRRISSFVSHINLNAGISDEPFGDSKLAPVGRLVEKSPTFLVPHCVREDALVHHDALHHLELAVAHCCEKFFTGTLALR